MTPHYRFLFLMDPYPTLNLETETSLLLMNELLARGQSVFWLEASDVYLRGNRVYGRAAPVTRTQPLQRDVAADRPLEDFHALLVRKDPPFDQGYLQLTLLLDYLPISLVQFNAAAALRNFNEKLLPLRWPALSPPTLVSSSSREITTFLERHQRIVLKPLHDCSGRGIECVSRNEQAGSRIERYLSEHAATSSYVIAQRFLPEVADGDKRVYLVAGEPVGWVNRLPAADHFLANIHQGGRCEATGLTAFERRAVASVAPFLVEHGIFLAGLDFIGDHLTEINITSPSAIRQINQVMNTRLEAKLVDAMLGVLVSGD